jgi:alkylated DNA repair dioxygenase AlkB
MNTLFAIEPEFPPGFSYFPGFLDEREEAALCTEVLATELHDFNFQGFTAKRRVASFGYDYSFDKRSLSKGRDIPLAFNPLIQKVSTQLNIPVSDFSELLITEYPVGSVINWHRDAPPFHVIAGLSLLTDCVFRLRPHEKEKQNRASTISFPVRRRSLYVIQGAARSDWQHSIAPVKGARYSITLRTLRR